MAKKILGDLEAGNKNLGGLNTLFSGSKKQSEQRQDENETPTKNEKEDEAKTKTFSLNLPMDKYKYIRTVIGYKTLNGQYNYNLKDAVKEGLNLLKKKYPDISYEALDRRFYKGGKQKGKIETYSTSSIMLVKDVNWIDNYIVEKRRADEYFSKTDFIIELVDELEKVYRKKF